jgi:fatty acid-binding protein DegV
MFEIAKNYIGDHKNFTLAIAQGDAMKDALRMKERLLECFPTLHINIGNVSPALGVHTGPGLLAIAIQLLD